MKPASLVKLALGALILTAAVALPGCDSSDPVAVSGSRIILTTAPNPVDLILDPTGTSDISARLETSTGVPQQDTLILFSILNGQGTIDPPSETTDSNGVARAKYRSAVETTATIEARSGSVAQTVSLSVQKGTPVFHSLDATDKVLNTCLEPVQVEGQILGAGNAPIVGVQVTLEVNKTQSSSEVDGTFTPTTLPTDSQGRYNSNFLLSPNACTPCASKTCDIVLIGRAPGKDSNDLNLIDSF